MKIPLSNGGFAIIDDADYDIVKGRKWERIKPFNSTTFYAFTRPTINGVRIRISMHRLIIGVTDKTLKVDHRNRDGLDNQRSNLRIATPTQSNANRAVPKNNHSGFKGVRRSSYNRWRAQIRIQGNLINLGTFGSSVQAAHAYDLAAVKHWGEFAWTNLEPSAFTNPTSYFQP